jgi:antitoxin component YwqK of YwqJK toxin-antitoxin module
MKKHLFIPVVILFTAFNTTAQHHQNVEAASMKQSEGKKLLLVSSLHVPNPFQFPSNGEVTGYVNDQLLFSGHVRKQKLNGSWVSFYTNNNRLDSGYLRNGIPDGEWMHWDSSGQLLAIRNYDADKLHRVKEEMRLNHPKRIFYPLTDLYKNNKEAALYYLRAGYSFSVKQHTHQSLQQLVESNADPRHSYHPVFNESLHHGLYMNFFSNGIAKDSGYYKNGLREGVWLHRNSPGGSYFTGAYKNGVRQREWKQYDTAGRLHSIIFYIKNGQTERTKKINR